MKPGSANNMYRCITVWIVALLSITPLISTGQATSMVAGKVMLAPGQPLAGATVSVYQTATGKLEHSRQTGADGSFHIQAVLKDQYVYVSHVGYISYKISTWAQDSLTIILVPQDRQLEEVVIRSKKPFLEQQFDRLIAHVDGDSKAGINATDVLKKLPGVAILNDNTVMLEGKAVTVSLDGKLTRLSGNELMALLRNMPAAAISQIEVIHSPFAKYDAQGDGGIINIRSLKRIRPGYNAYVSLTGGHGWKYLSGNNASAGLNYRNGNNYWYGSYAYGLGTQSQEIQTNTYLGASGQRLSDSMRYRSPYRDQNMRLGWDHYLNKTDVLGLLVTGYQSSSEPSRNSETGILALAAPGPDSTRYSDNRNSRSSKGLNLNINYKLRLDSARQQEINMDGDAGIFDYQTFNLLGLRLEDSGQQLLFPQQRIVQSGNTQTHIYSYKADYTQKLHNGNLEGGIKAGHVNVANRFFSESGSLGNTLRDNGSNDFLYEETVLAAYISTKQTWNKLTVQLGLRAEHTTTQGTSVTLANVSDQRYLNLFPNLVAGYKLSSSSLSASYSRRIGRPTYSYLNPFVIVESAYTVFQGNPNLRPALTDNYRLGINMLNNKLSFSLTYSESKDVITDLALVDDQTKITSRLKANLSTGRNSGFNFGYNNRFFNRLDINYSGTLRYSRYHFDYAGSPVTVTQFTGQAYLDNQLELPNNWWLNVYTFASTRVTYGNNITLPMTTTSLSGGTKLLKNKATLSLSLNDVFFTGIQRSRTDYGNVHFDNRSQYDSRNIRLNFTYNFGSADFDVRKRSSGSADEQRRN
ncbi:TonB-dependent receptor [Mucilaginibacter sp. CAU 1740]|uniref:TonB-dependent receptor domain-containing protein n=1 Tax=Mucilaginibacter sp. CAU 1740 TaxID=3140365 RepID=UPI00325B39F2